MTEDLLNSYNSFLVAHGYRSEVSGQQLHVHFAVCNAEIQVRCEIPDAFPYVFPKVVLVDESIRLCSTIPHRFTDHSLCLFDNEMAKPDFRYPNQILLATIQQAEKVIREGIQGSNKKDFDEEFLEYWNTNSTDTVYSFINEQVGIHEISVAEVDKHFYVADKDEELRQRLQVIHQNDEKVFYKGLFVAVREVFPKQATMNNIFKELYKVLSESEKTQFLKLIIPILEEDVLLIVLSIHPYAGADACLIALNLKISFQNLEPSLRSVSSLDETSCINYQKTSTAKIRVLDCSQKRLFSRGSYHCEKKLESVSVIGCGSLGGTLAVQIASLGANSFVLVDNDVLAIENIARHVCGFFYLGYSKTIGLSLLLRLHNPNISCFINETNAFALDAESFARINTTGILFVAASNLPLEAFLLEKRKKREITVPIVLCWVEPFCYAAHMLYVGDPKSGIDVFVDEVSMKYKLSVIDNSEDFIIHEAGCQSGYVQYSGLDVQQYLSRCLRELMQVIKIEGESNNYHLVWIGDIADAKHNEKIKINDRYQDATNYSLCIKRIIDDRTL